jgi:hypothetical protein
MSEASQLLPLYAPMDIKRATVSEPTKFACDDAVPHGKEDAHMASDARSALAR